MSDVGKLAVGIVANPSGFSAGIKAAEDRIGKFVGNVQGSFASLGGGNLTGALGGLQSTLGSFGSLAAAASNPAALLGGAAAFAAAGLREMYTAGERSIKEVSRFAGRFGMGTEAASGLALAAQYAGTNLDELTHPVQHLARHLADAAGGGTEANHAFSSLGLSARTLSELPLDNALGQVLDRLRAMPNAGDRAAASFRLFGRSGQEMERMISGGSAAILAAARDAQRLGISVSGRDARAVNQAVAAERRARAVVGSVPQSFAQAAAVGMAPASTAFHTAVSDLVMATEPLLDVFRGGIREMGTSFGGVLPVLTGVTRALSQSIQMAAQVATASGRTALGIAASLDLPGIGSVNSLIGRGVGATITPLLSMLRFASLSPQGGSGGGGGGGNGLSSSAALARQLEQTNDAFMRTIATAGMSAREVSLYELSLRGASRWQLLTTDLFGRLAEAATAWQTAVQAGLALVTQFQDPADRFETAFNNLSIAFTNGSIDAETFGRTANRAFESIMGSSSFRAAGAAQAGSREAYSAEVRAAYGDAGPNAALQARIDALVGEQQQSNDTIIDLLQQIAGNALQVLGF